MEPLTGVEIELIKDVFGTLERMHREHEIQETDRLQIIEQSKIIRHIIETKHIENLKMLEYEAMKRIASIESHMQIIKICIESKNDDLAKFFGEQLKIITVDNSMLNIVHNNSNQLGLDYNKK